MDDQEETTAEGKTEQPTNEDPAPIKRSFTFDKPLSYEQKSSKKPGKTLLIVAVLLIVVVIGFLFKHQIKTLVIGAKPTPASTPVAVQPTPTPNPLVRPEWSFEVLNGSGESGLAKIIAGKIQGLGYQVVKTGNADNSNYSQTQILVRQGLQDKIDVVIADLKDVIKIASIAGQLQEGTASARIIIGKDSI